MTSTFAKPYIFQFVKVVEPASKCLCKLNQPLFLNQLFPCFPCFLYRHGRRTRAINLAWWSHLGPINRPHLAVILTVPCSNLELPSCRVDKAVSVCVSSKAPSLELLALDLLHRPLCLHLLIT